MHHHRFAMVGGQLHHRSRHGEIRSPVGERVLWGHEYKKIEELYWEVMTGELMGQEYTVKKIDPAGGVRLDNLVKVLRFQGFITKEYALSHYEYYPETGELNRRYKPYDVLPKAGLSLGGERFTPVRLIWMLMKGENLNHVDRIYFKDGDDRNLRWANLALDRRSKVRGIVQVGSGSGADVLSLGAKR